MNMPYTPYYGYQPSYYQPMSTDQQRQSNFTTMAQPAQQPQQSPIIWVQGEEAAKAYLVAPGNSVLLMDSEGNRFYLKSTDAQGMPMPLRVFDYTERTSQAQESRPANPSEFVTRAEFDALAARIEKLTAPVVKEEIGNE